MKKLHKIIAASLLASAATTGSSIALAESSLTANVGVTSTYMWRGLNQSGDEAAVSGGIDYAHDNGAYVGTWVSNLAGSQYEHDIYAGYAFDAGPVGLDIGYISYMYPVSVDTAGASADLDFSEIYVNASYDMFSAGIALTTSADAAGPSDHQYIYVGAEFEVKKDLTVAITYGDYDFDGGSAGDYSHTQISLSKGDFTFAFESNDADATTYDNAGFGLGIDDNRFTVSWSTSTDL